MCVVYHFQQFVNAGCGQLNRKHIFLILLSYAPENLVSRIHFYFSTVPCSVIAVQLTTIN